MKNTTIGESCLLHARIGWQGLTKKEYLDTGDYYLITGTDFNNGHIDFNNCHYVAKERYEQDQHIQVGVDDVLVTKDGTIGKVAIIDTPINKPATLNSGVFVVRPKDKTTLLPRYLMIVLLSNYFNRFIERIKVGCTIAHLNQEKFINFEFPLPLIEDQKKIVSIFDSLLLICNKRKQELKVLDDLIKARFVEMFGDPNLAYPKDGWQRIADIGTVVGGSTPKTDKSEYWDGEYRWLTPAEIVSGSGYIYDSVRKITKAGAESCSLQEMPIGTVILSSRAPIGKVAIAGNTFYCNQGFKNIICNDKVNSVYLYSLLLFNTNYLNSLGRGATFKEISKSIVENIKIPLPDIYNQNQFADFVTQIDKSKVVVQKALDEAQLLFDSLMQKYFG